MVQDLTDKELWNQDSNTVFLFCFVLFSNTVLTIKPFALSQVASDFAFRKVWMLQVDRIRGTVPSRHFGQGACI